MKSRIILPGASLYILCVECTNICSHSPRPRIQHTARSQQCTEYTHSFQFCCYCMRRLLNRLAGRAHCGFVRSFSNLVSVHARAAMCDGWYPLQPTIFRCFVSLFICGTFFLSLFFYHENHYFYIVSSRSTVRVVSFIIIIIFNSFLVRLLCSLCYLLVPAGVTLLMWFCIFFFCFVSVASVCVWALNCRSWLLSWSVYTCVFEQVDGNRVVVPTHHSIDKRRTQNIVCTSSHTYNESVWIIWTSDCCRISCEMWMSAYGHYDGH